MYPAAPDLKWMEDLFPGFVLQQNPAGQSPHIWQHFGQWLTRAKETKGTG